MLHGTNGRLLIQNHASGRRFEDCFFLGRHIHRALTPSPLPSMEL